MATLAERIKALNLKEDPDLAEELGIDPLSGLSPDDLKGLRPEDARSLLGQAGVNPLEGQVGLAEEQPGRPGALMRALASLSKTPEGQASILRNQGFDTSVSGDDVQFQTAKGRANVDPRGFDLGDIGEVAGEIPATLLGAIGSIGGIASPVPGGGIAGGAVGSGLGDFLRQKGAQAAGSGEETDLASIGMEAAMGAGGELVSKIPVKALTGPFRKSTQGDDFLATIGQLGDFDTRFGTNLEQLAPADVQSGSDFLSNVTQRLRESSIGGPKIRKGQEIPFQRELESGFEALRKETGAAGPSGTAGPLAERVGERQAGADFGEAIEQTLKGRREEESGLFGAFEELIDKEARPALTNTEEAIADIRGGDLFRRGKTGSSGREALETALQEAEGIENFGGLRAHRQGVADEIDDFVPGKLSTGTKGQLKRLLVALKQDEEAFLRSGGKLATAAEPAPTAFADAPVSRAARAAKPGAVKELTPSQVFAAMGGLDKTEVKRIIAASDLETATKRQIGKLGTTNGGTIETLLAEAQTSPDMAGVLRSAGIETPKDVFEAVRKGTFWKKFPAGEEAVERSISREEAQFARGGMGDLLDEIETAGSIDDLKGMGARVREARDAGVIDDGDIPQFREAVEKRAQQLQEGLGEAAEAAPVEDLAALEAGTAANAFTRGLHNVQDSKIVQRVIRDKLKLSEVPDLLRTSNADEIRVLKQAVGVEGAEGGLKATTQGREAWERIAAEVLEDLRGLAKSKAPALPGQEDIFILSGDRFNTALDKFKPESLNEIFGAETAGDIKKFANMIQNADISERGFANRSGTGRTINDNIIKDIGDFFFRPGLTAAKITGRIFAETGAGKLLGTQGGKNFLLGKTAIQEANPTLLSLIGRIGGQAGTRGTVNAAFGGSPNR